MSATGPDASQATINRASIDPAPIDPVLSGSPDAAAYDFAESQKAGVAAVIGLARGASVSASPATGLPTAPSPVPPPVLPTVPPTLPPPEPPRRSAVNGAATRAAATSQPLAATNGRSGTALVAPDAPPAEGQQEARERPRPGLAHPRLLLLIAVLTVQALLSLRLVWSNTAYIDEATYLWGGHLEISHLLHGTSVPPFQTWLSGAPVIYPPIGALADAIGGVVGARILSLVFMMGATVLLWNTTLRLFGGRAAFFAAALFAVLGPTQFLGALATYDAMALLLVAISTWCVVAAREQRDSTALIVIGGVVLALANATKYATTLFDPVIVVLAALVIAQKRGAKPALGRAGYIAALVAALVAALLALGGPLYMSGVMYTTLARAAGHDSPALVLQDSAKWAGVVWVFGLIGVIICLRRGTRVQVMLVSLLAIAGVLAPLEQARIHTITSLHKHVDFGAWLAAPAAGYALAQLSRISKHRSLNFAAAIFIAAAAVVPTGAAGLQQARSLFAGWPDSSAVVAKLRGLTRSYPGNYLAEDYDIPAYYLRGSVPWSRWSNTWFFSYPIPGAHRPLTGASAFRQAIVRHYFSLVILDFGATPLTDRQITGDLELAGGYHIVAVVGSSFGQYTIWAHRTRQPSGHQSGHG